MVEEGGGKRVSRAARKRVCSSAVKGYEVGGIWVSRRARERAGRESRCRTLKPVAVAVGGGTGRGGEAVGLMVVVHCGEEGWTVILPG